MKKKIFSLEPYLKSRGFKEKGQGIPKSFFNFSKLDAFAAITD
jgi:hypothetical protein